MDESVVLSSVVATLIAAGLLAAFTRRRSLLAKLRVGLRGLRHRKTEYAWKRKRERWIREATRMGETVVVRHIGANPTRTIYEGACADEEWYFRGNLPLLKRYVSERRAPHLKSSLGRPPRLGTRKPCRC
jgi:hypothetical protein